MNRSLLLLRNGKAEKASPRALKDSGKRQVQRVGVWLAGHDLLPDFILAAPSDRAFVSAQKALKAGGASAAGIEISKTLGGKALVGPFEVLRDVPSSAGTVLVVAHRKALERLARGLTGQGGISFTPGKLLHLSVPGDWHDLEPGACRIVEAVVPEDLPEKFPFTGPGGTQWRDRPAYYYRQSAVIPWRVNDGRLEILVITSSKRNHWVVPKGIHEPGLSAQASAAREAEEEAGVIGDVGEEPLGAYVLEKWGATCDVWVYPMRVTRVIPEADWDESHRSRLWVRPDEAAMHLKHDGLKAIIKDFARSFVT